MSDTITVGSVIKLKSGSPPLTVEAVKEGDPNLITVWWYEASGGEFKFTDLPDVVLQGEYVPLYPPKDVKVKDYTLKSVAKKVLS